MSFGLTCHYFKGVIISLCIGFAWCVAFILCIPSQPVLAATTTAVVNVSTPTQPVSPGSQFTIDIEVQPGGAIAGAQFNLSFNPSCLSAIDVSEGSLFDQNGASTFFMPGQIDNNNGLISFVVDVITSPGQTVSAAGTLAVVTMTAGSTKGTSLLSLSNVVVGDINGQSVSVSINNGQVIIDNPPVFNALGNQTVNLKSLLTFVVSAMDADNDSLTYSASNLPTGASFNASTRAFSWTPALGQAGTCTVTFTVSDGMATSSRNITITVNKLTPAFSNLGSPSITYGTKSTKLGGSIKLGSIIPSGTVSITLNGVTQTATIDSSGNFISSFTTGSLATSGSPFKIVYSYNGDMNFNKISDSTKSLTIKKSSSQRS